jgi:lipopolysaccharide/colanic/teichoic acid biosynthesis glycosyltransferase
LAELVERHECGAVVAPGDTASVVARLAHWMEHPDELEKARQSAFDALLEEYDMPKLAEKWIEFIDESTRSESDGEQEIDQKIYRAVKRLVDVCAAGAGLAALAPVLGGAALAIRATMGSPVFFRQQRPGLNDEPFELLKFRTMRHPKPAEAGPESDGARITGLGAFLRATSIDELPTLLNVLRGDMTLVGPRPLLMRYLDRYTPEQRRRHQAKPGVTGWAQVNGRNALSWEEKFAHDVWYVDHRSLLLDLKILLATVGKVLERDGISQDDHATMPEFLGTQP